MQHNQTRSTHDRELLLEGVTDDDLRFLRDYVASVNETVRQCLSAIGRPYTEAHLANRERANRILTALTTPLRHPPIPSGSTPSTTNDNNVHNNH